jgi:PPIC-type PPIASE domain
MATQAAMNNATTNNATRDVIVAGLIGAAQAGLSLSIMSTVPRVQTARDGLRSVLRIVVAATVFAGISFAETASPGNPVVVVHGACPDDKCTTAVSRQELEDLMNFLSPSGQVAPGLKSNLGKNYAELLALASAARALGIDRSSQFQSAMRWFETKTLADLLRHRPEIESSKVTEEEIQNYYREYASRFEVVTLRRLALPKNNFAAEDRWKFEQDAQRVAAELRERAVHGEDLERLQKEGYETLGLSGLPPATQAGNRRRTDLASTVSETVFSLQPGEVSQIENETYSFVIYRVEAKSTPTLENVREEISHEVSKEKLKRALKAVTGDTRTELNEQYFGTASLQ